MVFLKLPVITNLTELVLARGEHRTGCAVVLPSCPVLSCPAGQHFNFRPVLPAPQDEVAGATGRTGEGSPSGREDRTYFLVLRSDMKLLYKLFFIISAQLLS
jgi:hypothetical protein